MSETSQSNIPKPYDWKHDLKMELLGIQDDFMTFQDHWEDGNISDARFFFDRFMKRSKDLNESFPQLSTIRPIRSNE